MTGCGTVLSLALGDTGLKTLLEAGRKDSRASGARASVIPGVEVERRSGVESTRDEEVEGHKR